MKSPVLLVIAVLLGAAVANAKEPVGAATDDAGQPAYGSSWNTSGGGSGFGEWKFQQRAEGSDAYAGTFIADNSTNPEMQPIGLNGKAFGLYANGPDFEAAAAFRAFLTPLQVGDTFSFRMLNVPIEQKGATDSPAGGSIGLTLRNGNAADSHDDYNKGARFEIANIKGTPTYQVYDGQSDRDTGVAYTDKGIVVTVTLTGADTYDLSITSLGDKQTKKLSGRKLGGSGAIESFCIFDRNGEKADGFFNNFQVVPKGK